MSATFRTDLKRGEALERDLDVIFGKWYFVRPVGMDLQRMGVDRIFTCRTLGRRFTVEYKSDERAFRTGNLFIETVSVDTEHAAGWAVTSVAQIVAYYVPGLRIVYILDGLKLKQALPVWMRTYRPVQVSNRGGQYHTHGLPIPIETVIEACMTGKVVLPSPTNG